MKILVYADVIGYGGHEIMCLAACDALREYYPHIEIEWLVSPHVERLIAKLQNDGYAFRFLEPLPQGRLVKHPIKILKSVLVNARLIRTSAPDVVMIAQGIITVSFLGSWASSLAGTSRFCYIPSAALASDFEPSKSAKLLDHLWRFCFRRTPNYVTIGEEQRKQLAIRNPKSNIEVVENYIPRASSSITRAAARAKWHLSEERKVIGIIGRTEFATKNQGWLVNQLSDPFWLNYDVLFVGDGPDMPILRRMIERQDLSKRVRLEGWSQQVDSLYPALDLLLLPSRSEGVPLVMLEALANRVPVVGTNRDGMKEWLPEQWRFEVNDAEGMKRAIVAAMQMNDEGPWRGICQHLKQIEDRERFARDFFKAIATFQGRQSDSG